MSMKSDGEDFSSNKSDTKCEGKETATKKPSRCCCCCSSQSISRSLRRLNTCISVHYFVTLLCLTCTVIPLVHIMFHSGLLEGAHHMSVDVLGVHQSLQSENVFSMARMFESFAIRTATSIESDDAVAFLCSLIDHMDNTGRRTIRAVNVVSFTNETQALCSHGDPRAPSYRQMDGCHTNGGEMDNYTHLVDPDHYYAPKVPPEMWSAVRGSRNYSDWLRRKKNDSNMLHILQSVQEHWSGNVTSLPLDVLWSQRATVQSMVALTYPIRWSYTLGSNQAEAPSHSTTTPYGIASILLLSEARLFLLESEDTAAAVNGVFYLRPQILGLCPMCLGDDDPLVYANTWGQPVVNDTSAFTSSLTPERLTYMYLSDVTDPFMLAALEHVDVSAMQQVGYRKTVPFSFHGTPSFVSAVRGTTDKGMPYAFILATPSRSTVSLYMHVIFCVVHILFLLVLVAVYWVVLYALFGQPLQEVALALEKSSETKYRKRVHVRRVCRWIRVTEVDDLITAHNEAMVRLNFINSFIPRELIRPETSVAPAYRTHLSCVKVSMASPITHTFSQNRTNRMLPSEVSFFMDKLYELSDRHGGVLTAICDPGDCKVLFFSNALSTLRACGDGRETRVPRWDEGPLLDAARQDALNALAFVFAVQESLGPQSEAVDQLGGRICHCLVDSQGVTTGLSFGQHANQHVFVAKGDRSVCDDLGYLLPKLQVPICITEETFRLVRQSVRAIPLEALRVGFSDVDEYGVVLYEALSGPVDDEAWLKYATHFCNAFGHMLRGDYGLATEYFDAISTIPGLDAGFLSAAVRDAEGLSAVPKTHQLDRLLDICIRRVLLGDSSSYLRYPLSRRFLNLLSRPLHDGHMNMLPRRDRCGCVASLQVSPIMAGIGVLDHRLSQPYYNRHLCSFRTGNRFTVIKDQMHSFWSLSYGGFADSTHCSSCLVLNTTGTLAYATMYPLAALMSAERGSAVTDLTVDRTLAALFPAGLMSDYTVANLGHSVEDDHIIAITEWYPGGNLREMMSRYGRVLPTPTIIRYIVSILSGLQFLHSRRVVHGDVRPETVLVGTDGRCKLTGFFGDRRLAEHVLLLPTSCYMSPEVARGGAPSAASDVYCAGLVLVEMLTGGSPWRWSPKVEADRSPSQLDQLLSVGGSAFAAELCAGNVCVRAPDGDCSGCGELLRIILMCVRDSSVERPSAESILNVFQL